MIISRLVNLYHRLSKPLLLTLLLTSALALQSCGGGGDNHPPHKTTTNFTIHDHVSQSSSSNALFSTSPNLYISFKGDGCSPIHSSLANGGSSTEYITGTHSTNCTLILTPTTGSKKVCSAAIYHDNLLTEKILTHLASCLSADNIDDSSSDSHNLNLKDKSSLKPFTIENDAPDTTSTFNSNIKLSGDCFANTIITDDKTPHPQAFIFKPTPSKLTCAETFTFGNGSPVNATFNNKGELEHFADVFTAAVKTWSDRSGGTISPNTADHSATFSYTAPNCTNQYCFGATTHFGGLGTSNPGNCAVPWALVYDQNNNTPPKGSFQHYKDFTLALNHYLSYDPTTGHDSGMGLYNSGRSCGRYIKVENLTPDLSLVPDGIPPNLCGTSQENGRTTRWCIFQVVDANAAIDDGRGHDQSIFANPGELAYGGEKLTSYEHIVKAVPAKTTMSEHMDLSDHDNNYAAHALGWEGDWVNPQGKQTPGATHEPIFRWKFISQPGNESSHSPPTLWLVKDTWLESKYKPNFAYLNFVVTNLGKNKISEVSMTPNDGPLQGHEIPIPRKPGNDDNGFDNTAVFLLDTNNPPFKGQQGPYFTNANLKVYDSSKPARLILSVDSLNFYNVLPPSLPTPSYVRLK